MKGIDALVSLTSTLVKTIGDSARKQTELFKDFFDGAEDEGEKNQTSKIIAGVNSVVGASSLKKLTKEQTKNVLDLIGGVTSIVTSVSYKESIEFSTAMKSTAEGISTILSLISVKNYVKLKMADLLVNKQLKNLINGIQDLFSDIADPDNLREQGIAIKTLGEGILSITKAIKSLALVSLLSIPAMVGAFAVRIIIGMFQFASKNYKDLEQGGKGMEAIGRGLVNISIGLGAFVLLGEIAGYDKLIKGTLMLGLLSGVFILIGIGGAKIRKGALGIQEMGKALVLFTVGMASLALFMEITGGDIGATKIIKMLAAFSITFLLIGVAARSIEKGADAVFFMSIGMATFALAVLGFDYVMKHVGYENVLYGSLVLGTFATAFWLLGKMEPGIIKGATAGVVMAIGMAALGLGIMVFAFSIEKTNQILKADTVGAFALMAAIIGGMTVAFTLLGLAAPFIIPGAAAAATIGIALFSMGVGLLAFSGALNLVQKMGMMDKNGNLKGFNVVRGLVGMFSSIFLESIFAIPGIAVGIAMGAALLSISVGLLAFGATSAALVGMGALDADGKIKATYLISDLISMFASVALDSVFAVPGIAVTLAMGLSLLSIAWGLNNVSEVFAKLPMQNGVPLIADQLNKVITSLFSTFKGIADLTAGSNISSFTGGAFIKNLTGTDPITMGIKVVSGMGNALLSIAEGIGAFTDLQEITTASGKTISLVTASSNIATAVDMIWKAMKDSIISIGTLAGGKGFIDSLKSMTGSDPISLGLNVLKQLGGALKSVVGGISAFANFSEFPTEKVENGKIVIGTVDLWAVAKSFKTNLPLLFTSLAEGFKTANLDAFDDEDKLKLLGQVGSAFGTLFTSIAKINDLSIDPKKIDSLRNLSSLVRELSSAGKNFSSFVNPFSIFANALNKFNTGLSGYSSLTGTHKIFTMEIKQLSDKGNGMFNFARGFQIMAIRMNDFATNFKKMDKDSMNTFKLFNESLKVFSTLDPKKFQPFLEQVKDFYEPIKENVSASRVQPVNQPSYATPYINQPSASAVMPEIDLSKVVSAINDLKQEIIMLNSKFKTGKGGALLTAEF